MKCLEPNTKADVAGAVPKANDGRRGGKERLVARGDDYTENLCYR